MRRFGLHTSHHILGYITFYYITYLLHPLPSSRVSRPKSVASVKQQQKRNKYGSVAARIGAELSPFAVESSGGMAQDALKLIHAMAEEGEDTMRMWSGEQIARHSLCLTATAVQRGNAMMMLHGYTQCRRAMADTGNERSLRKVTAMSDGNEHGRSMVDGWRCMRLIVRS